MREKSLDIASEILPEENLGLFQANILAMHLETVLPSPSTMYINGDFRSRTKKHWNDNRHKGERDMRSDETNSAMVCPD